MNGKDGHEQQDWQPFSHDYDEERSDKDLAQERKGVQRQVDALRPSPKRAAFDAAILRSITRRRSKRSDLLPVEVVVTPRPGLLRRSRLLPGRPTRGRALTPVVRGELLVRATLRTESPDLWHSLQSEKFTAEQVEGLDNRLIRLTNQKLPAHKLDRIARMVRSAGQQCSVNHVAPLAPMIKGEGGPEPTRARLSHPPHYAREGRELQQRVRVAVIDTGITATRRNDGWLTSIGGTDNIDLLDAIPTTDGFLDFAAGHGTFATGIVERVAPRADISAYRAVDSDGIGSEVDVALAMVRAAAEGANIINLSLGAETLDDQPLVAIEVALDIIAERWPDVLVIAAAGNTGASRPVFPGASPRVTAVGALDPVMAPAEWSTRGWWVDCSAIGEGVLSTYVEGVESPELDPHPDTWPGPDPWAIWSGTSFAAPQISGGVARLCGETAGLTPQMALKELLAGGRHIPDYGVAVRILPGT